MGGGGAYLEIKFSRICKFQFICKQESVRNYLSNL